MTETTEMIKAIANDSKVRIDRIVTNYEQLEKENAELQGSLELYENGCCRAENKCAIKDQLSQAKEIIKQLLSCCRNYPQENAEKIKQSEQFLQEIEE